MIGELVMLGAGAFAVPGAAVVGRLWEQRGRWRGAELLQLQFPAEVEHRDVSDFLIAVAGLGVPRGALGTPVVGLESVASAERIEFQLVVPAPLGDYVRRELNVL